MGERERIREDGRYMRIEREREREREKMTTFIFIEIPTLYRIEEII